MSFSRKPSSAPPKPPSMLEVMSKEMGIDFSPSAQQMEYEYQKQLAQQMQMQMGYEYQKQLAQNSYSQSMAQQMQMAQGQRNAAMAAMAVAGGMPPPHTYTLMDKLRVRLNMHPTAEMPFEHINPVKNPTNDKVVVFLIVRGVPMFIEDDAALFPTDSLVGKLNLLR